MAVVEVVKFDGNSKIFAWKYPNEELGTWTQLIVNESQEVVFLKGGQALDVLGPGRHTLDTANIPFISKLINLPFGGRSPFTAEVWYINKASNLDIKWGTPTPIQIQDPKYGVFVPVRANGIFGVRIKDSKKFLVKIVGTLNVFNEDYLVKYFRGIYITKVKDIISSYFIKKRISILEVNAYIDEISNYMKEAMLPTMDEYGIEFLTFNVNEVSIPEEDSAVKKLKDALAKKAEMNIIGYDYRQERSFDTLQEVANNSGSGSSFINAGMGLGIGVGMGSGMGNSFSSMMNNINTENSKTNECPNCHSSVPASQKFCGVCGYDMTKTISNSIVCPNCGASINSNNKFCPECGAALNKVCPKCGSKVESNQKFCPECGEKL